MMFLSVFIPTWPPASPLQLGVQLSRRLQMGSTQSCTGACTVTVGTSLSYCPLLVLRIFSVISSLGTRPSFVHADFSLTRLGVSLFHSIISFISLVWMEQGHSFCIIFLQRISIASKEKTFHFILCRSNQVL